MTAIDLENCNEQQKEQMKIICENFKDALYIEGDVFNKFKHTDIAQHFIELKPGTTPVYTAYQKHKRKRYNDRLMN